MSKKIYPKRYYYLRGISFFGIALLFLSYAVREKVNLYYYVALGVILIGALYLWLTYRKFK